MIPIAVLARSCAAAVFSRSYLKPCTVKVSLPMSFGGTEEGMGAGVE